MPNGKTTNPQDVEKFVKIAIEKGVKKTAALAGVSPWTVSRWCRERGVKANPARDLTNRLAINKARRALIAKVANKIGSAEASRMYGVGERKVQNYLREFGYIYRGFRPEEKELIERLLEDGAPYAEVARTVGRKPTTIRNHFPGHGWAYGEVGKINVLRRRIRYGDLKNKAPWHDLIKDL